MIDLQPPLVLCANAKLSKETADAIREGWQKAGLRIFEMLLTPEEARASEGLSIPREERRVVWEVDREIIVKGPIS